MSKEILEWAKRNFDVQVSRIGLLEEIGEAAHCIAKNIQGIRGFDNHAHFKRELSDAIADAGIYCLHNMADMNVELEDELGSSDFVFTDQDEAEDQLSMLATHASDLLAGESQATHGEEIHHSILQELVNLSAGYEINFMEAVTATWAKVKQRNWRENKTDADQHVK